jgi:ribosomal protein L11 methyltransferase
MSSQVFWVLPLSVRSEVVFPTGDRATREEFFSWIWQEFLDAGLTGVHEGTVLSDEAHAAGFETESWVLDSAEAPHFRDWIGQQGVETPELYFADEDSALAAAGVLALVQGCVPGEVRKQEPRDWDAEWKKNFKGIEIPSFGMILPPWEANRADGISNGATLILNPGAGFGTGTHETTQLCLQGMSEWREQGGLLERVLDFGSGSGILAIGAALKGAGQVHAVEIDPLAVENARENARLNSVVDRVVYSLDFDGLSDAGADHPERPYDLVFANILRPVLIQFADALCSRVRRDRGCLVLSGLVQDDLAEVIACYSKRLGVKPIEMAKNEWRALRFSVSSKPA